MLEEDGSDSTLCLVTTQDAEAHQQQQYDVEYRLRFFSPPFADEHTYYTCVTRVLSSNSSVVQVIRRTSAFLSLCYTRNKDKYIIH